ncbi:MAG: hypothetical protein U0871_02900 [Gemmataceae bacterium]
MSIRVLLAAVSAAALLAPSGSQAGLIGDTVTSTITPGIWVSTPTSAVVGAGSEFTLSLAGFGAFFSVDVGDTTITLNYVNGGGLSMGAGELYVLSDLNWNAPPA